jgi:hypothetical protein
MYILIVYFRDWLISGKDSLQLILLTAGLPIWFENLKHVSLYYLIILQLDDRKKKGKTRRRQKYLKQMVRKHVPISIQKATKQTYFKTNLTEWHFFQSKTDMNRSVLSYITPYSTFKANRYFRGICRLHLQSWWVNHARNEHEARSNLSSTCCLLYSSFFFRNVGWISSKYTALYPRN